MITRFELVSGRRLTFQRTQKHQRVDAHLTGENIHGIKGEVSLSTLNTGQIARTDVEVFSKPFLTQSSGMPDVAQSRTQHRFERIRHQPSVSLSSDDFQVVIASTKVQTMSSYTRRKCPVHNSSKPTDAILPECTCGIHAAAKAAIALRPIPDLAIKTGASVAAAIAVQRAGFTDQADLFLTSLERTVFEANGD